MFFSKIIERKVDARIAEVLLALPEDIVTQIKPILVDALRDGHTDLATHYLTLRKRHEAMRAAYTAAVGADSFLSERGVKAYFKRWHDPAPSHAEDPWAIRQLLERGEKGL